MKPPEKEAPVPKKRLFGTNGVRGRAGIDMTPDLVLRIGIALGSMRNGTIAVGRDTRTSGEMLLHAIKAGLLATGCDVVDCGILPTPALQYLIRGTYAGGAMITASHNPPEYNGVKIIEPDGTEMGDEETLELERRIAGPSFTLQPWQSIGKETSAPGLVSRYIDGIVARFPDLPGTGMLVVADPGSGPACATTPEILRRIGCRVLTVNGTMDGTFPGRLPEPSEDGLAALSDLVQSSGAAFGVAHDGDADRAVFVDENGRFVEENCELALFARSVCRTTKGYVVTPVSSSGMIETVARESGCTVIATRVGSINVARTMHALIREGKTVVFGGEGNGGPIFPSHQFCRDGGMTAAMMVAILAAEGRPLSALVAGLPRRVMIKGKIATADPGAILAEIAGRFPDDTIDRLDGLKILRGTAWVLVRASGTEPLIRIIADADTGEEASALYNEVSAIIEK
ncbi:MAG TPA: phosphoglucosamine mutase [Methanoregulaceae archaeon]|nr:phosphoglucosamine mutase [Methanoregulaceae archaeon]